MNHHQPDLYTQIDSLPASQMRDVLMQLALAFPAAFEAALKEAEILRQAAESRANPYGSYPEAKHGLYTAPSAAYVARGVPHLPQHVGGNPRCSFCGQFHEAPVRGPLPTAEFPAARLAGHMPEGAL